jgi:Ser/Thr protein kinase RdoA (MazF antagonist)
LPTRARLIELNELQAGRAVDSDRSWPQHVVESVATGFSEYMVLATLANHSKESRELLDLCQRAVERYASTLTETRDIVHWDFTLDNVLVDDGHVSGVIDWAGTRSGDRLFDMATLLDYARGEDRVLERYLTERIGPEGISVYLAHLSIRQSDWSLPDETPATPR